MATELHIKYTQGTWTAQVRSNPWVPTQDLAPKEDLEAIQILYGWDASEGQLLSILREILKHYPGVPIHLFMGKSTILLQTPHTATVVCENHKHTLSVSQPLEDYPIGSCLWTALYILKRLPTTNEP